VQTGHVDLVNVKVVTTAEETMPYELAKDLFESLPEESSSGTKVSIYSFVVKASDGKVRTLRCSSLGERERWIEAITMQIAANQFEAAKAKMDKVKSDVPNLSDHPSLIRKGSSEVSGVDFAPIGKAFNLPKYLYHSNLGGSCWGGAKPPIPTTILVGDKATVKSEEFGKKNVTSITVSPTDTVTVQLTNGGTVVLPAATLAEIAANNKGKSGDDLAPDLIECTGMRYPGDPLLICRVAVAATVVSESIPKSSAKPYSAQGVILTMALLALQPLLLQRFTNMTSIPFTDLKFTPSIPSLGMEQATALCIIVNSIFLLQPLINKLTTKRTPTTTYNLHLLSYEESEASTHSDGLEKAVPTRFVNGTKTDPPGTAERRWATTMAWRKREKVDAVILGKHPFFDDIKKCYPHFYCRTSLDGVQIAYYERPGFLDLPRLQEIGVPTMVMHYTFQTEFCWMYMACDENVRTLSGIDIQNVGLYDLKGVVKEFLGAISKISQEHYPERAGKICVLNAPGWFSMMWNVIKLMLHPNTQKKVFILSESAAKTTMKTLIKEDSVPVEYGGTLEYSPGTQAATRATFDGPLGQKKESCRWASEFEVALQDYVHRVNKGDKLPLPCAKAFEREDFILEKEDYLKMYEGGWLETESQLHLPREQWDADKWPGMLFAKKG